MASEEEIIFRGVELLDAYSVMFQGSFKLNPRALAFLGKRGRGTKASDDKKQIINKDRIKSIVWVATGRRREVQHGTAEMRVTVLNGTTYTFGCLENEERDKVAAYVSEYYQMDMETAEMDGRGWNFGEVHAKDQAVVFTGGEEDNETFHLPYGCIKNVT
ncbi:hypothetical protein KIPB_001105, partial [Kipferlia bialata]|eukprot:g1105.t1